MWDMPDATAAAAAIGGGLDHWTLGDIQALDAQDPQPLKAESNLRTVEEIGRQQHGALPYPPGGTATRSPQLATAQLDL
eukprot:7365686-Prorocentrum_lima.AAC.1